MKAVIRAAGLAAILAAALFSGCADMTRSGGSDNAVPAFFQRSDSSGYSVPDPGQVVRPAESSEPKSSSESSSSVSSAPASSTSSKKPGMAFSVTLSKPSFGPTHASSSSKPVSSSSSQPVVSYDPSEPIIPPENAYPFSILSDYTVKWAYNHITPLQQQVYRMLFNDAEGAGSQMDTRNMGVSLDDITTAYWAFDYDNPQFLRLGSGFRYRQNVNTGVISAIEILYGREASEVPQADFNRVAHEVVEAALLQATDYDKLKYVHDWIVNNTKYTVANAVYETEADGPLVSGKAICEGYSKAFMYFAQTMGFECVCLKGTARGEGHMWNMVKLEGQWYNVDVTWDDPVMSSGKDTLKHTYFLVSDRTISADHTVNNYFDLPLAPYDYAAT